VLQAVFYSRRRQGDHRPGDAYSLGRGAVSGGQSAGANDRVPVLANPLRHLRRRDRPVWRSAFVSLRYCLMSSYPNSHHRRLEGYDYTAAGFYSAGYGNVDSMTGSFGTMRNWGVRGNTPSRTRCAGVWKKPGC